MSESDTSSDSDTDRAPGEYPYTAEYFLKKELVKYYYNNYYGTRDKYRFYTDLEVFRLF